MSEEPERNVEPAQNSEASSATLHIGYALAVLIPVVGLLVGIALIARGDDEGGWVVVFALGAMLVYGVAFAVLVTS